MKIRRRKNIKTEKGRRSENNMKRNQWNREREKVERKLRRKKTLSKDD